MSKAQAKAQDQKPSSARLFVTVGLIVVVVAVIGTFGLWKPSSDPTPTAAPVFDTSAAAPTPAAPATIAPGPPAPATAGTPKPNEYDAANNRHWNAAHGHWHPGPPPGTADTFNDTTLLTPQAAPPQTVAPGTPKPFEYDEENNRYWDPSHGHWHPGPPPTPPSQP